MLVLDCGVSIVDEWEIPESCINSLAPGRYENNFKRAILNPLHEFSNSYEIALGRMPFKPTGGKSTLVQVMAWCRQATSHYLCQCWYKSMSPCGVTSPQWVKPLIRCLFMRSRKISNAWGSCFRGFHCFRIDKGLHSTDAEQSDTFKVLWIFWNSRLQLIGRWEMWIQF